MRIPSDYRAPSDANLEAASRAGGAHLASLEALEARHADGEPGPADAPLTGWEPYVDALSVDASRPLPDQRIVYFAWAGRISIVSGEAKAGKSTVLTQALCAAITGKPFANNSVLPLTSVAIATEEPQELVSARLQRYGLSRPLNDGIVWIASPREGVPALLATAQARIPEVFIIDSLTEWAYHCGVESMNDPLAMRKIINQLRILADLGIAILVVHHGRKEDGELRDSVDLAASPDLLIGFHGVDPEGKVIPFRTTKLRRLSAVGRWPVDDVFLGFHDGEYYVERLGTD